jgi:hypothetical protein
MAVRASVDGVGPFVSRLEKFDKDVAKVLKREMKQASDLVRKEAVSRVPDNPLSGWGPWMSGGRNLGYEKSRVRSSYKTTTDRYRRRGITVAYGYSVVTSDPAASIFETVGAKKAKGNTSWRSSSQFRRYVVNEYGRRPKVKGGKRILLPSYYAVIGKVHERVKTAIRDAERKVGM